MSGTADGRDEHSTVQRTDAEWRSLLDDASFAVLRRFSQTQNVKLRQVAELVIENGALPEL